MFFRRLIPAVLSAFAVTLLVDATAARAQADPEAELVVATRSAPPFAMQADDGTWEGLSIDLWADIAAELGLRYRFEEAGLQEMIDGVAEGRYAAAVAALTITPGREQVIDFTHPFFTTGYAIAVPARDADWMLLLTGLFSWEFLRAIALLALVLAGVGLLLWLAERKRNREQFGGNPIKGIGSGFWLSAVTMTTVGYGDKAPATLAGRVISLIWMFLAIIIISTFTGMIASSLTAERLGGAVNGPDDLPGVRVGTIAGTASAEWLDGENVRFRAYDTLADGLDALQADRIDAFVYDEPIIRYLAQTAYQDTVEVLPGYFGRQDYGIGLPQGSDLREPINRALLSLIEAEAWTDAVARTLNRH